MINFNPLFVTPEWLNTYHSKYPEGLSVLENIIDWITEVNNMVEYLNLTKEQIDNFIEKTMPENLEAILDEWYLDGKLADVLNLQLLGGIKDELIAARNSYPTLKDRLAADKIAMETEIEESKNNFFINVKKFGAKGDGVTDDSAAIQAAIDYAFEVITMYNLSGGWMFGGGKVFFPSGKYILRNKIVVKTNVHLMGETQQSVILDGEHIVGDFTVTNQLGDVYYSECDISHMTFVNKGIYFVKNYNAKIYDVSLFNVTLGNGIGILMRLNVGMYIERIHAYNCNTAMYISGSQGVGYTTTTYFKHLWIAHCNTGLILSFDSNGIVTSSIKDSIIEYCDLGINMQGNIADFTVDGMHFEQCNNNAILAGLNSGSNVKLRNLWYDASNGYLFTSRNYGESERFKLSAGSFMGPSGLQLQYGVRADLTLEDDNVIYSAIPDTVRIFNAAGDLISTAPPTFGAFERGDKTWNKAPNAGDYVGWVCVSSGSPGTWKGFGLIQS